MKDLVKNFFTPEMISKLITTVIGLAFFWLVYMGVSFLVKRVASKKLKPGIVKTITKILKFCFYVLVVFYILRLFNIDLTALLGAAGIAGVAIGFAAQTSFSNIISGFFIIADHALKVGDYITVEDVSGTVDSIDMLSVKIKTPENQMVRIPNETILKTNLHNTSFYPIRRLPINVCVTHDADLQQVLNVLDSVPAKCSLVLSEPAPVLVCDGFGELGINIALNVWINSNDLFAAKNQVFVAVKQALDDAGIRISFSQISLRLKK